MKEEIDNIVYWLKQQVQNAHVNGLLVGVSGGLDSAVVAYLIKQAFPNNSLGVVMPLKSNSQDIQDAKKVIKNSNIQGMTVDLTATHDSLFSSIQGKLKSTNELIEDTIQLADANLRARLRMSTLYTLAANYNYLVVGTDNKSEWYTGYFTKYGDGGVDILPIVDYLKSEVVKIGEYLGIPEEVLRKKPSADLWEGQTDEVEMGTTYDKIDAYLNGVEIPEEDQLIIKKMHRRTEHKRNLARQFIRYSSLI